MIHARAVRRLAGLFDRSLAPQEERALRSHLERCERCRRRLRQHEVVELWVARMPVRGLDALTLEGIDRRLAQLASWSATGPRLGAERLSLSALGAVALALALVLGYSTALWSPLVHHGGLHPTASASVPAEALLPLGWR